MSTRIAGRQVCRSRGPEAFVQFANKVLIALP